MSFVMTHFAAAMGLLAALLHPGAGAWAAQPDARQHTIAEAAATAQAQCYKHMYRDSNAYAQCLRDLRHAQNGSLPKKLGIEYFAFVGALSYMRVGHLNADQIAAEFLKDYRLTQKKVGISDDALCRTIPGDCVVRMAQTREMEAAPPPPMGLRVQCIGRVCSMVPAK
ncbi:hypothetical protein MIZ03_4288 [Rhodoferax lithotrophicus]|uniref:Secreted protein n=1 Tax=Rhodoferax lithotrophicus TaxID=2798804 RepID=A0ABM7MSP8_9BURK|nr:hypothetical protein [Rhodoferax sp. MIZ03]BCO29365.1 hypothetical protein MIZ03_4288 [Rhodoferax sp. MIZ03]